MLRAAQRTRKTDLIIVNSCSSNNIGRKVSGRQYGERTDRWQKNEAVKDGGGRSSALEKSIAVG
jgi:hypothetical protein